MRRVIKGRPANDFLTGSIHNDYMEGLGGNDTLYGGVGNDQLMGNDGNDTLIGVVDRDRLNGGLGNDFLYGGDENDFLIGSWGADRLYGDDFYRGEDVFAYSSVLDSPLYASDTIYDFQSGYDKLDLSAIDANVYVPGNQSFDAIYVAELGNKFWVTGNVNGDNLMDFGINVFGTIKVPDIIL